MNNKCVHAVAEFFVCNMTLTLLELDLCCRNRPPDNKIEWNNLLYFHISYGFTFVHVRLFYIYEIISSFKV